MDMIGHDHECVPGPCGGSDMADHPNMRKRFGHIRSGTFPHPRHAKQTFPVVRTEGHEVCAGLCVVVVLEPNGAAVVLVGSNVMGTCVGGVPLVSPDNIRAGL